MPVVYCPIDIPDGWEFLRYGVPSSGETFLNKDGDPVSSDVGCVYPWVIVRRARPAIEVGDWVRFQGSAQIHDGAVGKATEIHSGGWVDVSLADGQIIETRRACLIKQTRTIEPYTIDQLIVESAKRGRHVKVVALNTIIESIHIAGVTLSCPSIGFVSYVDATSQLTWSGGEAFGVERWEDAE